MRAVLKRFKEKNMAQLINKTQGFTVIPQTITRSDLSLKERGLLLTLLSLPNGWEYSIKGLSCILPEGRDSIRATVTSLEKKGYLLRIKTQDEKGLFQYDWEVFTEPQAKALEEANKPTVQGKAVNRVSGINHPVTENPLVEIAQKQTEDFVDYPLTEKPALDNPTLENPTQLNTKELNTKDKDDDNRAGNNPKKLFADRNRRVLTGYKWTPDSEVVYMLLNKLLEITAVTDKAFFKKLISVNEDALFRIYDSFCSKGLSNISSPESYLRKICTNVLKNTDKNTNDTHSTKKTVTKSTPKHNAEYWDVLAQELLG